VCLWLKLILKMQNIKILIEYDGTDFHGWQVQPGKRTVQGELEKALKKIFNKKTRITGSGRTDTGVHALGQVASFTALENFSPRELKNAINGNISRDILVKQCKKVQKNFNARFSALSRIYKYQIAKEKSVFNRKYFFHVDNKLDVKKMRKACKELIGEKDFSNLATKDNGKCYMIRIKISENEYCIFIELEANRFLRRMARGIVGLLIAVGKGELEPYETEKVLSGTKRRPPVAPPHGLFLLKINY
jgi:tRNA pseudouridine38-40 synthase